MFGLGIEEGPRLPMEIFDQICDDIVEPAELKILSGVSSSFRLKAQKRLFAESVTFAFANLEEDPAGQISFLETKALHFQEIVKPENEGVRSYILKANAVGSYRYTAGDNWVAIELYYSTLHQYLSALSSFPNLYHLSLSNVDITDEVCQYLTHIPKLSSLSLTDCYVFVTGNFDLNLSSFSFNLQNEDIEVDGTIAIEIFSPRNLMSLSLDTPVSCLDYVTNNISAFHPRLTHLSIDPYLISEKHVYHLLGGCPDLLSLTLTNTPMSSPVTFPSSSIPALASFTGPAEMVTTIVAGRPVSSITITEPLNIRKIHWLQSVARSPSVHVRSLEFTLKPSDAPAALIKIVQSYQHLRHLSINVIGPNSFEDKVAPLLAAAVQSFVEAEKHSNMLELRSSETRVAMSDTLDRVKTICRSVELEPGVPMAGSFTLLILSLVFGTLELPTTLERLKLVDASSSKSEDDIVIRALAKIWFKQHCPTLDVALVE